MEEKDYETKSKPSCGMKGAEVSEHLIDHLKALGYLE